MRLIDADALMREFAEFVRASNNSDFADVPTWNDAVSLVDSAPTIDPVKHGEWIEEPNCWYRCSNCGEHYPSIREYMDYSYCPNCGAKNGNGGRSR